ncbi:acyl-CoA dehydrogenase family protein [Nocardioides humi]|uniref:Acyl-CoA dehydrogenase family protein n=1 Tax=Nocardioides humi TaxID=449461 RepID=A0ABN2AEQ5_9ACTN|nr:acyl-CoA dehydrogenase family protein [Nocardioides humi]
MGPITVMLNIQTTTGHNDLRRAVRQLCSRFDETYWEKHDADHEFAWDFFEAFAKAGYLGLTIPEQYGGGGGSIGDACAVLEEVAAAGGGLNACSTVHTSMISLHAIVAHADEEFRRKYLPRIAAGEMRVSFGVTEPNAGTDSTRITTFARREGDKYVVNGQKVWISGAQEAEKVLLLVRTAPREQSARKTDGVSLILVDLSAPGVRIQPIRKIGRNAVDSNEIYFDDVVVEASDLVGSEGEGFRYLLDGLNGERMMIAAESVGFGRWSLETAVDYARQRVVFDRPIGMNQSVQHPLAAAFMQLRAAAAMVREAVDLFDRDASVAEQGTAANTAKWLASEAAYFAADSAMQTHGGYSFAREYHVGRYWMEARLQRIAPVNNQMILNYVSERVLGLPRSY